MYGKLMKIHFIRVNSNFTFIGSYQNNCTLCKFLVLFVQHKEVFLISIRKYVNINLHIVVLESKDIINNFVTVK